MKIKETFFRKFNRKTGEYDRKVSVFEKYKIEEVTEKDNGKLSIKVVGPKQKFLLCEQNNRMKDGSRYFFILSCSMNPNAKIQGAMGFRLKEGSEELEPMVSAGVSGLITEMRGCNE